MKLNPNDSIPVEGFILTPPANNTALFKVLVKGSTAVILNCGEDAPVGKQVVATVASCIEPVPI